MTNKMNDDLLQQEIQLAATILEQKKIAKIAEKDKLSIDEIELSDIEKQALVLKAQLAMLEKTKKEEERQKKQAIRSKEKAEVQEESEEEHQIKNWNAFVSAKKIYDDTGMHFFRDGQPKYFHKLTTKSWTKQEVEYSTTEIKFYPPTSLPQNWVEFANPQVVSYFRKLIEGEMIRIFDPANEVWLEVQEPKRVFEKITNTLKEVDDKTYNVLTLSDKLQPNYGPDEVPECPIVIKALMHSLSGNEIGVVAKPENMLWLEKWIYGAVHADIGNSMASLPVIFGPGKVGKNALFDNLGRQLLGKDACFTGTWDLFHGSFDGYKLGKVLMFIDEVPEKGGWSVLKNMTGSPESFVKQKYGAEVVIDNTVRYAIGTNSETYPLPVEDGPQMMRVSPIKTIKNSTFAENTVKLLDLEYGSGYSRKLLQESDNTLKLDDMSDFDVGDALLRNVLYKDWSSKEAAQQFLNYLDYTYKSDSGNYSLRPLRGTDWNDLIKDKKPATNQVLEYILDQNVDTISVTELYEIYKVIQQERSEMVKQLANFGQIMKPLLEENGYIKFDKASISGGIRVPLYTRTNQTKFTDYTLNVDRYILEVSMSNHSVTQRQRQLKYNDVIQAKLDELNEKMKK